MSTVLRLGWRNIWRNRRRTFITMSAIGIGLFLTIVYGGLVAGIWDDAKNQLDTAGMGHVELFPSGYRPRRVPSVTMPALEQLQGSWELPPGSEVSARVIARGLASTAHGSEPVELFGVDFEREKLVAAHVRAMVQGTLPPPGDSKGIVIGEQFANRLHLKPGSKLRVLVQRADGEMGAELFRVRGIFHSAVPTIGKRQVLTWSLPARELLGLGNVVHQVVIQIPRPEAADALAASVSTRVGDGYEVKSWGQLVPVLRRMEGLIDTVVLAVSLFVYLLVGLGIMNTMVMSVLERTREFGMLMAIGTRPSQVIAIVMAEAFWVATLAVLIGAGIGSAVSLWFSQHALHFYSSVGESIQFEGVSILTAFRTRFEWSDVGRSALFVYGVTLLVAFWPALRVSKFSPAVALRHT